MRPSRPIRKAKWTVLAMQSCTIVHRSPASVALNLPSVASSKCLADCVSAHAQCSHSTNAWTSLGVVQHVANKDWRLGESGVSRLACVLMAKCASAAFSWWSVIAWSASASGLIHRWRADDVLGTGSASTRPSGKEKYHSRNKSTLCSGGSSKSSWIRFSSCRRRGSVRRHKAARYASDRSFAHETTNLHSEDRGEHGREQQREQHRSGLRRRTGAPQDGRLQHAERVLEEMRRRPLRIITSIACCEEVLCVQRQQVAVAGNVGVVERHREKAEKVEMKEIQTNGRISKLKFPRRQGGA